MKVLLLGMRDDFSNDTGAGIPKYMYELYTRLKGRETENFKIEKSDYYKIIGIGSMASYALHTLIDNFDKYDIVHNLSAGPLIKPKWMIKSQLVSTAHDFSVVLHPEYYIDRNTSFKTKLWYNFVRLGIASVLKSDYVIARSSQTLAELIQMGYPSDRTTVINSGLDERFLSKRKIKKNAKKFIVGYIGSMQKNKNLKFAINAVNNIENKKNIKFEIWGKKTLEYVDLKSIVRNKNTVFMGFAPENKLVQIYDSFDAFVFPSLYEGLGLPIREAQARGLPVIVYKYAKLPKEIKKYCFEAESQEHMAQIIENLKENGYNEKLRKRATEYARSFTWEKCAIDTLNVYKKITAFV